MRNVALDQFSAVAITPRTIIVKNIGMLIARWLMARSIVHPESAVNG